MANIELKHVFAKDFHSCAVTGVLITGPLPDGYMQITFHREIINVTSEQYAVPDNIPAGTKVQLTAEGFQQDHIREDVSRIFIHSTHFAEFAKAFSDRAEMMAGQPDAQGQ